MSVGVETRTWNTRIHLRTVPSIGVEDRGHEFYDHVVKLDGRAWRRGSERPNYGRGRACCPARKGKSARPVFQAGFYPPAVRAVPERYGP